MTRSRFPGGPFSASSSHLLDRLAPSPSVADVLAESPGEHRYCGYGKGAMRAILDALDADAGDNVVLPAAVPHAFVEPLRELGVEPRYHRVAPDLGGDLDHLADRLDDGTAAVVLVHYFGFVNPDADAIRGAAADADVPVVEDNSHAALSAPEGRLLGADSAFGFASLHKTLPVPDGAVLYADGSRPVDHPLLGVADGPTLADARFLAASVAARTGLAAGVERVARALGDRSNAGDAETGDGLGASSSLADRTPTPYESMRTYEAAKRPMSWLTARVLERTPPGSVVAPRREGYERWTAALDASPLYDLEPGVCPWMAPVVVDDAPALARRVPGAFAWPRLPRDVAGEGAFPVANDLARTVLALPVDRPGRVPALASVVE